MKNWIVLVSQGKRLKYFIGKNALLLLVCSISFVQICLPFMQGRVYASFDILETMIPTRLYYSIALENGEIGLWNPFLFRGYDHIGIAETGSYHPVHYILYRFLPVYIAIAFEILISFPLAFLGMLLLLRSCYRLSITASLAGAGVFSLSSFFMAHFGQAHMVSIYAHLPWVIYAIELCFGDRRNLLGASFLAFLYGSMLLLCHPQMPWLVSFASAGVILYRLCNIKSAAQRNTGFALTCAGIGAGVLIGMIQLIPIITGLSRSDRGDLSALQRNNFSLHPLNLLPNFSPAIFADKTIGDWIYSADNSRIFINSISEFSAYFGVALLTLIFSGLVVFHREIFNKRNRLLLSIFAGVMVLSFLLMLGRYGSVNNLLSDTPLISQMRSPDRYKIVITFYLAVFFAVIMHLIETRPRSQLAPFQYLLLCVPLAATSVVSLVAFTARNVSFRGEPIVVGNAPELLMGPILSAGTVFFFVLAARHKGWAVGALAALCVLDLAIYGIPIVKNVPYKSVTEIQEARAKMISQDKTFRRVALDNKPLWDGYYLAEGYMGMTPRKYFDYSKYTHIKLASISHAYADDDEVYPFENPLPRIRLVRELRQVDDSLEHAESIDLETTALCEFGIGTVINGPPLAENEKTEIITDGYERTKIRVSVKYTRLLVISDYWTPDWRATIDGRETDLLPLFSGAIRGIIVEPGDHVVELVFRPGYLPKARFLCFAGLSISSLLLIAGLLNERRFRRK